MNVQSSLENLNIDDLRKLCPEGVSLEEKSQWLFFRTSTAEERIEYLRKRRLVDNFINETKVALAEENREEGQEVIVYERNVFKLHLKVPYKLKVRILELILKNRNSLNFPEFKVYNDSAEQHEDRTYPEGSIGSFVFYFDNYSESATPLMGARVAGFFAFKLFELLEKEGLYAQIPENIRIPRFSYELKNIQGQLLNGFTITQGDGDFKNRCFFPGTLDKLFDPQTNFAFFSEDSLKLKHIFESI